MVMAPPETGLLSPRPRRRTAGYSRGTVSRYVNGERYVSAAARDAIEAAIAKVGYVPNTAARNLQFIVRTQTNGPFSRTTSLTCTWTMRRLGSK